MVSALVWNTGSGRAAIAPLLTLAAAPAPPALPANRKKTLLEFMMASLRGSGACGLQAVGSGQGLRVHGIASHATPIEDRQLQTDLEAAPCGVGVLGCIEDRVAPYTQLDVREGRDRVPALRACGCVVVGLRDLQIQTSLGRLAASVRWGQRLLG